MGGAAHLFPFSTFIFFDLFTIFLIFWNPSLVLGKNFPTQVAEETTTAPLLHHAGLVHPTTNGQNACWGWGYEVEDEVRSHFGSSH